MKQEHLQENIQMTPQSWQPLVSLITVVYNGATHLEEAMKSVFIQTYPNIEYIVIDGGSTDGTLDIIRKYAGSIDYWVSEPDRGIYDAMNKGIGLAKGEIVGFVNADDGIYPHTVANVVEGFSIDREAGFVYGTVDRINQSGKIVGQTRPFPAETIRKRYRHEMPFAHPALFVSKKVYNHIGLFDTSFKVCADYDMIIRMMNQGFSGVHVDQPLARFRSGGISDGVRSFTGARKIHKKHGISLIRRNQIFLLSLLKLLLYNMLPSGWMVFLKRIRKQSRHTLS